MSTYARIYLQIRGTRRRDKRLVCIRREETNGEQFMSALAKLPKQFRPPIITCPSCGDHMRLSTIVPEEYHRERMTFVCECGFDYRQSSAVAIELGL